MPLPQNMFVTSMFVYQSAPAPAPVATAAAPADAGSATAPAAVPAAAPAPDAIPSPSTVEDKLPQDVQSGALENVNSLGPIFGVLLNMAIGATVGVVLLLLVAVTTKIILNRRKHLLSQLRSLILPGLASVLFLGSRIGLGLSKAEFAWAIGLSFLLLIGVAASFAWLALRVQKVVATRILGKYRVDSLSDRRNRRIQTQMKLITRILTAVIITLAVAAILLAIPQVRALGAGLLASAGLISVVAGLAVQSTLTNVFAGFQLAFTDSIRVGDVVEMDEWYGTVEDITLSVVVVKIWDERRIIFPSSYFTTQPFTNYTRVGTAASGTVEFQVDWRVPMDALRARLKALVNSTSLWDGKDASMQVTETAPGTVTARAVVSAATSGDLWDLRCLVREDLVAYIRAEHPYALYTMRTLNEDMQVGLEAPRTHDHDDAELGLVPQSALLSNAEDLRETPATETPATETPAAETLPTDSDQPQQHGTKAPGTRHSTPGVKHSPSAFRRKLTPPKSKEKSPKTTPEDLTRVDAAQAQEAESRSRTVRNVQEPPVSRSVFPRIDPKTGAPTQVQKIQTAPQPVAPHPVAPVSGSTPLTQSSEDSSLYTGSITSQMRGRDLAGPGADAYEERARQTAESTGVLPVIDPETGAVVATTVDPEGPEADDDDRLNAHPKPAPRVHHERPEQPTDNPTDQA